MNSFASNESFVAPVEEPYLGEATKVAMTAAQRANGFMPGTPIAVEHLNYELAALGAAIEGSALSNLTTETSGTANSLNDAVWDAANEQFVAVGGSGTIIASPQGRDWTAQTTGVATELNGVAASPSVIVAVGDGDTALSSDDGGATWESNEGDTGEDLNDVEWFAAASLFVAVGNNGAISTSPDGVTWTSRSSGVAVTLFVAGASPSLIVAAGSGGALVTSPDGINWTVRTSGTANGIGGAAWKDGLFVVTATNGTILTSPDGITWTARTSGTTELLRGAAVSDRYFMVVGNRACLISRDGITWQAADDIPTEILTEPAWNGRCMVIAGLSGLIMRSQRLLVD